MKIITAVTLIIFFLFKSSECTIISRQMLQDIYHSLNDELTFARKKAFQYGYQGEHCSEDPIQRCSCIEILYGIKDLKPGFPHLDEQDIKMKRRTAVNYYHPDKINTLDEQPFHFLNMCAQKLLEPKLRKYYFQQLQFFFETCEKRAYDDRICRDFIEDLNNKVITVDKTVPVVPFEEQEFEKGMETLYVFLDDSGSMLGSRLTKARNYLKSISHRLYESNTNVYFIGNIDSSRQIVTHHNRINEHNFDSHILNIWKAEDESTFLWEFIWKSMKDTHCIDCEIIIITDGIDNESDGLFNGPTGFDELMMQLKARNVPLPRVHVYCDECSYEIEKYYQELSLASGGYLCLDDYIDNCTDIINLPHFDRIKLQSLFQEKYYGLLEANEIRQLPWMDSKASNKVEL